MQHYISLVIITRRSSGCTDWLFFAQQLPHGMHDKILALADGCLSRQYRGDARVCKFWHFRDAQYGLVLDEVLRDRSRWEMCMANGFWDVWWYRRAPSCPWDVWWYDERGPGPLQVCQTCGRRRTLLRPSYVNFARITVHRRVSFVPRDGYHGVPDGGVMRSEERDVCEQCFELLYCGAYMEW